MFEILYKKTKANQIQQWQIVVENDTFYTIEGIKDGVLTTSKPTKCLPTNVGRSNHRTANNQALYEAEAKYVKKISEGYSQDIETSGKSYFEPMLAHDYEKYKKLLFTVPTFIQPKLDGVRCYMSKSGLTTRNGKKIVSCPHLELLFEGLDGELYNHDLKDNFNKIISLVRKTKPTIEDKIESSEKIEYWIYDFPGHSDKVFSVRYKILKDHFDRREFYNKFKLVPTYEIKSEEELLEYHKQFINQGFEGSIIRMDLGPYENKRSKQLLKYKDWKDEEFYISDILPGVGNRADCGNILMVDVNGKMCGVTATGTMEFMRDLLKNKSKYIGQKATVKFFGYTEDGMLRFPTLKSIRNYE
jgi:ATP-dependent DNA ligase